MTVPLEYLDLCLQDIHLSSHNLYSYLCVQDFINQCCQHLYPELMIQFSQAVYRGSEESRKILVTINLVGGLASYDVYFFVNTSAVSATGNNICSYNNTV